MYIWIISSKKNALIINLRKEVWKDYHKPEWRDNEKLKISNFGRAIRYKYNPDGELAEPYILGGYENLSVMKRNGKTAMVYIHRAVAELFLENIGQKKFVVHKDYDKRNNHLNNLAFVDRPGLSAHHKKNPAVIKSKLRTQEIPKYAKLNAGKVKMIKRKIFDPNRKTRMRLIAKQFGISEMQLYRIKSGENWGHIEYEPK